MQTPKFINTSNTSFYQELKTRVNNYFVEQGKKKTGGRALYIKAGILFSLYLSLIHI